MSMTPVPISIRLVLTPIAASSGNGDESWRAKWWTRTKAPSIPISSAATASSTVWRSASPPVRVSPPPGCHAPKERKPILFLPVLNAQLNVVDSASIPVFLRRELVRDDDDVQDVLVARDGERDRGADALADQQALQLRHGLD